MVSQKKIFQAFNFTSAALDKKQNMVNNEKVGRALNNLSKLLRASVHPTR